MNYKYIYANSKKNSLRSLAHSRGVPYGVVYLLLGLTNFNLERGIEKLSSLRSDQEKNRKFI